MKCQHCHKNEATVYYRVQVNGQEQSAAFCPDCYDMLTKQQAQSMGTTGKGPAFGQQQEGRRAATGHAAHSKPPKTNGSSTRTAGISRRMPKTGSLIP